MIYLWFLLQHISLTLLLDSFLDFCVFTFPWNTRKHSFPIKAVFTFPWKLIKISIRSKEDNSSSFFCDWKNTHVSKAYNSYFLLHARANLIINNDLEKWRYYNSQMSTRRMYNCSINNNMFGAVRYNFVLLNSLNYCFYKN